MQGSKCSDTSADPCHICLNTPASRYCKYTKAFSFYTCCSEDESSGICGSSDPDVICSNQFEGLLSYSVCYADSLACGSSVIFIVNQTMSTTTSDYFKESSVCYY